MQSGSSPRVRGKLFVRYFTWTRWRLIPACAGKTKAFYGVHFLSPAHPRVCGENSALKCLCVVVIGSSPRVRGKHRSMAVFEKILRLIPACAGKTIGKMFTLRVGTAHPRVCGENGIRQRLRYPCMGSSPRVRGKLPGRFAGVDIQGLIPACAGKTLKILLSQSASRAHPRVCGENQFVEHLHDVE